MSKIKVGVIGVGHLGEHHTRIYSGLPQAELVGIYDSDLEKAKSKAEKYKTTYFMELDQLLQKVEAVSLVVPTSSHYEVAKKVLNQGIHILIEKPITETVEQAEELIQIARKKNLTLQVGHIERFNPAFRAIENIKLEPKFIESHRLSSFVERGTDVAVILDLMIHDLDLILYLVKDKIKSVEASGVAVITETEDIANARITFENGCVANITASRISARPMRKLRIFQKNAYISLDFLEKKAEVYRLVKAENKESPLGKTVVGQIPIEKTGKTIIYEKPEIKSEDMLTSELSSFLHAVATRTTPQVTGEQAKQALELALEIKKKSAFHLQKIR
ncbi:MAG: Gfo/Idh/MocA family oxidoreductase [candidate division Zixibacteria bacterium]|nr:Gfo/Idh/MocA family oxidoreductase [candidate division Zixibacteria bacterium]